MQNEKTKEKKRENLKEKKKNYQFNLFNFKTIRKRRNQCYKIVNNRSNI